MKNKYYVYQMNLITLNISSIFLLLIVGLICLLIDKDFVINSIDYLFDGNNTIYFFLYYFIYIILHELLHSLSYVLYGAKFNKIEYGMEIEKGILYCLCKQDISRKNILNSLFFPLFYIGIITLFISYIVNSYMLFLLSVSNIVGCIGDIIMFIFIVRLNKDVKFSECNDSTSFAIKSDKDISDIKPFGLKYLGIKKELDRKMDKKINISKLSLIFILFIILSLIYILINH